MPGALPIPGAPLPMTVNTQAQAPQVPDELRRAAEEFEAVFLSQMLAPMFDGLSTDGLGGGGMGEEIFRPMLIERYADAITRAGGVGIADSVMREMMRLQEMSVLAQETADGADR